MKVKQTINIEQLNQDIESFPQVHPITTDMTKSLEGVSKLVMLDRYAFKDTEKKTLAVGDFVVLTIKEDPKFPARGTGFVTVLDFENNVAQVQVEDEYHGILDEDVSDGLIKVSISVLEKPLEVFYEQIALRNATGLTSVEKTPELQKEWFDKFYEQLASTKFVPAGRVLYGAGSDTQTTFFNCYVMPYIKDSREGISDHRSKTMEIMSRGGGVGTNGSTLRPRNALARGVNGKSSGMVSWLHDLACLTNLVEQGGSRRGAQMIMVLSSHPDVLEFIISKMQNPKILKFIIENFDDEQLIRLAKEKLKFVPLSNVEKSQYDGLILLEFEYEKAGRTVPASLKEALAHAKEKLRDGGHYEVHNPDFLAGANISVALTSDFMEALEKDTDYSLQFPDTENYSKEEMQDYNDNWHNVGDPRKWAALGYGVKTYRTIKAKVLWDLINLCATYAAEPGIFFIDNANDMTNAKAYGQEVVATNPCGEQPLAPYSVCNLAAVNLAQFADKVNKTVKFAELIETVKIGVRMQDNVIDATPYFLEENKTQALGERRVGLGVMGLADLLIYCEKEYGSEEGNELVDKIFETIAVAAYEESIELAKERDSFPFLQGATDEETERLRDAFINTGFMKKMPEHIREGVLMYGIRNSHLLTVAPTGSTGTMAGVATGLEPYFSFIYYRSGRLGKFIEVKAEIVQEYLAANPGIDENNLPSWFKASMELSAEAHADVQCIIQRWIDSSISKTVNAPKGYTVEQVQSVYERLWRGGAKGGTVYVDGSRDSQVLTLTAEHNSAETTTHITEKQETKIFVLDTIVELTTTNVNTGSEIGDTCPVCRKGQIRILGGCNTCDNCKAQVSCGL